MAKRNKKIHRLNPNAKNPTLDFISFVLKEYPLRIFIVIVAIVVSALATIKGTLFMKNLVDDYIVPMTKVADPDFGPLAMALFKITLIYLFLKSVYLQILIVSLFQLQKRMLNLWKRPKKQYP